MAFNSYNLKVKAKTWKRDSYGLFDYEAIKDYQNQRFSVSNSGQIIRLNHQVSFSDLDSGFTQRNKTISDDENIEEILFYTVQSRDGIKIIMNHPKSKTDKMNENNQLWNVVPKGNTPQGFVLKAQDIIKLGRVMFKIIQMKIANETKKSSDRQIYRDSIINSIRDHIVNIYLYLYELKFTKMTREETFIMGESPEEVITKQEKENQSNSDMTCKICLYNQSGEDNDPLISPCKCIGSVKYVHLKCMQNWIRSKCDMQHEGNIITILWKNLNCELCKEKLPVTFLQDEEEVCLIPLDQQMISDSYVILESFSKDNDSIGIHLIDLSVNQNLIIGRGHDCDIKVSDISVSREHARITFSKGRLYIRDNNSKFGTLVKRAGALVLNSSNMKSKVYQQIGRTIFKFSLERPWISFIPCLSQLFNTCSSSNKRIEAIECENNDETRIRIIEEDDEEIQVNGR